MRFIKLLFFSLLISLQVSSQVLINPYAVQSAVAHDDIYAAYGTDFDDLLLPEGVTWQEGDYDPLTEGTYAITGSGGQTVNVHLEKYALKLDPSNLYTMLQEGRSSGTPVTDVTTDLENVGTIYDLGKGLVFNGGTTLPTLASSSAFGTLIKSGATAATLICQLHRQYFKPLHAVTPVYCIRFVWRFETGSDGVFTTLFRTRVSAGAGISLRKTTGDKLQMLIYNSSGTMRLNYTTTVTVNEASGVIWGTININGTGANASSIHVKTESGTDTSETFTVSSGSDASTGGTSFEIFVEGNQSMGALQIMPRIATADEITAWKTYNPARHSTPFLIKNRDFNPSVQANVFTDAAGTVGVTEGGIMRFTNDDVVSPFGPMPGFLAPSDAASPIWNGNSGQSYGDLNNSQQVDIIGYLNPELVGKSTTFIVASNEDETWGSHYLSGGTSTDIYMVQTGANYAGNPLSPYMVTHPDNGFGSTFPLLPSFEGANVYCIIRDKTTVKGLNNDLTEFLEDTNHYVFRPVAMGPSGTSADGAVWTMDGRMYRVIKYSGAMPEARAIAIRDELKAFYAIP